MPRKAVEYKNTIIYKLVCKDLLVTQCYIGHTTNFTNRKGGHKSNCNNSNNKAYNCYVYSFIRENGGWDNWIMIEVEKYPCLDVNEACKRERYYIELLKSELNQIIPSRTKKEWCEENIDHLSEKKKEYYNDNKEYILEKQKIYNNEHKEDIKEKNYNYYNDNKEILLEQNKIRRINKIDEYKQRDKNYYEKNRDEIIRKKKDYYEQNKDQIKKKQREQRALKKLNQHKDV